MREIDNATPIWPYIWIVACLFVLAAFAPRSWRSVAIPPGAIPEVPTPPAAEVVVKPPTAAPAAADNGPVLFPAANPVRRGRIRGTDLVDLSEFESPRHVAKATPPVADRVALVPAHSETRAAPASEELSEPVAADLPNNRSAQQPQIAAPVVDAPTPAVSTPAPVIDARSPVIEIPAQVVDAPAPVIEKRPATAAPVVTPSWPRAKSLVGQLQELLTDAACHQWTETALAALERLRRAPSRSSGQATTALQQLESLTDQASGLAKAASNDEARSRLLRAGYAIQRRVAVWRQVHRIMASDLVDVSITEGASGGRMAFDLQAVDAFFAGRKHEAAWREYLALDEIRATTRTGDAESRRQLARGVLARLNSPRLSETLRKVLQKSPFVEFASELRRWANEPVDYLRLLSDLEAFETLRTTDAARRVAAHYESMRWTTNKSTTDLAATLNTHYRNANIRVAIADDLLNRLLPPPSSFDAEIEENILGAWVSGTGRTSNRFRAVLVPDRRRWRIGLEAEGEIASQTAADVGPATFHNQGVSRYLARKLLLVDPHGVRAWDAEAEADSEANLQRYYTTYDAIPILGWLARMIALQQHEEQYHGAQLVTSARVEDMVTTRLDQEVKKQLKDAKIEFQEKVLKPLRRLRLEPTAVDMQTTERRVVARYRLAGDGQMAAFTPRPQAPIDSLLSAQVHETSLNNTLEQLELEGQRSDLRALYRHIADTFNQTEYQVPDDIPDNVTLQFASRDAVRVQCDQGRVTLTLRIAELKNRRQRWRNFAVRVFYAPDPSKLHANLSRDGVIHLAGRRLRTGDQVALRFIFSTMFSKNRPIKLISSSLADNPSLSDLQITQFVITDGWIGVAAGPQRRRNVADRAQVKVRAQSRSPSTRRR